MYLFPVNYNTAYRYFTDLICVVCVLTRDTPWIPDVLRMIVESTSQETNLFYVSIRGEKNTNSCIFNKNKNVSSAQLYDILSHYIWHSDIYLDFDQISRICDWIPRCASSYRRTKLNSDL